MKKIGRWLTKAFCAAATAGVLVSLFCYFFYNLPSRQVATGATDYRWSTHHASYRGTEGFAYTTTDENGYVNTYPKKKDSVDVLIMGSSHTEGFNVNGDENYTYLLNKMWDENGANTYAYNIGVSDHTMVRCFDNLETAIQQFSPAEYVMIETDTIQPSLTTLKQLDEGTFPEIPAYTSKLASVLQKSDFLRLSYAQITNLLEQDKPRTAMDASNYDQDEYARYLENMLKRGGETAANNGIKLVIVYSSPLAFDYHGCVTEPKNLEEEALFRSLCEKYGIGFINMHATYAEHYNATHQLPHGFSNSAVGAGHINKHGHACIAKELYRYLMEGEKK